MTPQIEDDGRILNLDGTRFHALWLYDNARHPEIRDPGNGQRLVTMADLPTDPRIEHADTEGGELASASPARPCGLRPTGFLPMPMTARHPRPPCCPSTPRRGMPP